MLDHIEVNKLDALITIGGDGTQSMAHDIIQSGVNCIGVPAGNVGLDRRQFSGSRIAARQSGGQSHRLAQQSPLTGIIVHSLEGNGLDRCLTIGTDHGHIDTIH